MPDQYVPLNVFKIMQTSTYTAFVLEGEGKKFSIFADPKVGLHLQEQLSEKGAPRPMTTELLKNALEGLDAKVVQTVIYDVQDTIYFAKLFIEQSVSDKKKILELDARPSDCLTLSISGDIPIYCHKDVLEKVTPYQEGLN